MARGQTERDTCHRADTTRVGVLPGGPLGQPPPPGSTSAAQRDEWSHHVARHRSAGSGGSVNAGVDTAAPSGHHHRPSGRASVPGGRPGLQNQWDGARASFGWFDSAALPIPAVRVDGRSVTRAGTRNPARRQGNWRPDGCGLTLANTDLTSLSGPPGVPLRMPGAAADRGRLRLDYVRGHLIALGPLLRTIGHSPSSTLPTPPSSTLSSYARLATPRYPLVDSSELGAWRTFLERLLRSRLPFAP